MMQTYLCNCDFRKRINQKGVEYGWDVAVYSSPEHIYGYDHVTSCYKEDPRTSWGKIVDHMKQLYPKSRGYADKKDSKNRREYVQQILYRARYDG